MFKEAEKAGMVTIKDVARKAGVSPSTVSHAFSGKRKISAEVKERIFRIARELNYEPNAAATSLVTKKTENIGMCVSSFSSSVGAFVQKLSEGIATELAKAGYRLLLMTRPAGTAEEEYYENINSDKAVDGIILTDPNVQDKYLANLLDRKMPLVVLGRPKIPYRYHVDNDNVEVVLLALSHLAQLGHRRVAFINGPPEMTVSEDRLAGYHRGTQRLGLEIDGGLMKHGDFTSEGGYAAMAELLQGERQFTAVVAANDAMAIGAIKALRAAGLRVPEEVSVVGINNDSISELFDPPLTTVDIQTVALGQGAARMLLALLAGDTPEAPQVVPSKLIVRASTRRLS